MLLDLRLESKMAEWKECTIGDICNSVSETYSRHDDYVVLINTSDVLEGKIQTHKSSKNEDLKGQFKKTFKKDDILYSEIRPANKRYAFVDFDNTENYIASTKLMVIRPNKTLVLPNFLYLLLTSKNLIDEMQHLAETRSGTFPQITFSGELATFPINLPPLTTQKKISDILSCIDAKIELNNKINDNLEQQAQAIFKSWFVDDSEKTKTIGDYITPKRGKNLLSKDAISGVVPVVAGGLEPATYHNTANTKAPVLTISASGANAGFVNLWNIPVWSSDSSFIDFGMTPDVYFWYVLLKSRQKEIFDSQTGSAQPHIYPQHIAVLPIANLDMKKISEFTELVTPFFKQIGKNQQENIKLISLRDTLLPKLMSSEIDVDSVQI